MSELASNSPFYPSTVFMCRIVTMSSACSWSIVVHADCRVKYY